VEAVTEGDCITTLHDNAADIRRYSRLSADAKPLARGGFQLLPRGSESRVVQVSLVEVPVRALKA